MGKIIDLFYIDFNLERITDISSRFWFGVYSSYILKSPQIIQNIHI